MEKSLEEERWNSVDTIMESFYGNDRTYHSNDKLITNNGGLEMTKDTMSKSDKELLIEQKRLEIAKEERIQRRFNTFVTVCIVVVILLVTAYFNISNIQAGHVKVATKGGASGNTKDTGWAITPFWHGYKEVRVNTQTLEFIEDDSAGDAWGSISVMTEDNLNVNVDIAVVYHLDEDKVGELIVNQWIDFRSNVMVNIIRNEPREEATNYSAIELIGSRRETFQDRVDHRISERLKEYNIIVESVSIRGLRIPVELQAAISEKKVAEQRVQTAEYQLEAQTHIANKTIVNATANRDARIIDAEGQEEAIRIVMERLAIDSGNMTATEAWLQYEWLQVLADPDSNIEFVITDGTQPMILDMGA